MYFTLLTTRRLPLHTLSLSASCVALQKDGNNMFCRGFRDQIRPYDKNVLYDWAKATVYRDITGLRTLRDRRRHIFRHTGHRERYERCDWNVVDVWRHKKIVS